MTIEFFGNVGHAGDTTGLGEVADEELFSDLEFGDGTFFGIDGEADDDGFFELTNAFAGDVEHFANLFEGFALTLETETAGNNFLFATLLDNVETTFDGVFDDFDILIHYAFLFGVN